MCIRDRCAALRAPADGSAQRAGEFVKEYCQRTEPHFVVGEFWDSLDYEHGTAKHNQDAHRQRIINWINAAGDQATAFDVTTKGILCALLSIA